MNAATRTTDQLKRRIRGKVDQGALAAIAKTLMDATNAHAVVLFGSRAKGTDDEDSDYDLCLVIPDDTPSGSISLVKLWALVGDRGLSIDLIAITRSRYFKAAREINSVAHEVWESGAIIAGNIPESAIA